MTTAGRIYLSVLCVSVVILLEDGGWRIEAGDKKENEIATVISFPRNDKFKRNGSQIEFGTTSSPFNLLTMRSLRLKFILCQDAP